MIGDTVIDARYVPFEPAWQRACARSGRPPHRSGGYCWCDAQADDPCYRHQDLAEIVGVSTRTVCRWAADGRIPARHSDELAIALGVTPYELWPDEWTIGDAA